MLADQRIRDLCRGKQRAVSTSPWVILQRGPTFSHVRGQRMCSLSALDQNPDPENYRLQAETAMLSRTRKGDTKGYEHVYQPAASDRSRHVVRITVGATSVHCGSCASAGGCVTSWEERPHCWSRFSRDVWLWNTDALWELGCIVGAAGAAGVGAGVLSWLRKRHVFTSAHIETRARAHTRTPLWSMDTQQDPAFVGYIGGTRSKTINK